MYKVLELAVNDGIAIAVRRAFKYQKTLTEEQMIDALHHEVMNEICQWFKFQEDDHE